MVVLLLSDKLTFIFWLAGLINTLIMMSGWLCDCVLCKVNTIVQRKSLFFGFCKFFSFLRFCGSLVHFELLLGLRCIHLANIGLVRLENYYAVALLKFNNTMIVL